MPFGHIFQKIDPGFLLVVALITFLVWINTTNFVPKATSNVNYPEIKELSSVNGSFKYYSDFFTALAQSKGAVYAYNVLKVAPLPPGTDLHLLGHIVGDQLFKQQGASGIKYCTQDFRNACSHAIVVGLFLKNGVAALPQIAQACRQAPGGTGAYTMCFHGLGHGILAFTGYDMAKTAELCKQTGTAALNNREYVECVGGSVMEIISGGGHDHDLWVKQNKLYLSTASPLSLCQSNFITETTRSICYIYLTPFLFISAGANLGKPTVKDFEIAFKFCDQLPKDDLSDRASCFGGFGKEFVVLAQSRDIRNIGSMEPQQLTDIYEWCRLAHNDLGVTTCIQSAMNSLYWGGENNYQAAVKFCDLIRDQANKNSCFSGLTDAVNFYRTDSNYRQSYCSSLPYDYRSTCRQRLGVV